MNPKKIRKLRKSGPVQVRHIMGEDDYTTTREEWEAKGRGLLPTWDDLKQQVCWGFEDMRILATEELIIMVEVLVDGEWRLWSTQFSWLWLTDFASVPKAVRSLVDNDEKWLILAAFWHDLEFAAHYHSFKVTNRLFWLIAKAEINRLEQEALELPRYWIGELEEQLAHAKSSKSRRALRRDRRKQRREVRSIKRRARWDRFQAWLAFICVSSPVGKRRWRRDRPVWQRSGGHFTDHGVVK
jgi:hypothetical protein